MKLSYRLPVYLTMGITTLILGGCATFRPMPTHAGGKRFDEEERILSATVYHSAGKMDFSQFKKRKIALEVTSLETTGAAEQPKFPGMIQDVNIPIDMYASLNYRLTSKLDVKATNTRQDIEYLHGIIQKRLRFDGYQVTSPEDADIYLVILVDSLGTNYNRDDYLIAYKDNLEISCEMTYYAIDAHNQKIITPAKAVASTGTFCEVNYRPSVFSYHDRNITDFSETIVPLPHLQLQSFTDSLNLAPVSEIQPVQIGLKKTKKQRKKNKKRRPQHRKKNNAKLPDFNNENAPEGDLLPNLNDGQDSGRSPSNDTDQDKIDLYAKRAEHRIEGNDIEGAKKQIERIRKLDPESPAIPKLEKQLQKASSSED